MLCEKYYFSLDGLDSRNGHKTLFACGGKVCYTWDNKLIDKSEIFSSLLKGQARQKAGFGGIIMSRIDRNGVKERVEKKRQGLGSDKEVAIWIEEIKKSVPNQQIIATIMAGNEVSNEEIVDRLYKADVICL